MKGIRQRKDGAWFIDYRVGGRRVRKFFGSGKVGHREAVHALTARKAQITLGQHPGRALTVPTFAEAAAEYLRYLQSVERRAKTLEGYESMLDVHLIPAFGPLPLDRITKASVIAFLTEKRETPRRLGKKGTPKRPALRTVDKMRAVLGGVLGHAVYRDLIRDNVVRYVKPFAKPADRDDDALHILASAQIRELLAATSEPYRTLYQTAVSTGLRRGELLALRWSDIDSGTNRMRIHRGRQRVKDGDGYVVQDGSVKTRAGRRTIEIFPELREALLALPAGDDPAQDYVFRNRNGGPLDPDNLDRRFKKDLKLAGLPEIRFHDLRHTHASLLIAAGVHPKAIQARLGHASIKVTMDTYGHLMPSAFAEVGVQFDALLRRSYALTIQQEFSHAKRTPRAQRAPPKLQSPPKRRKT